MSKKEIWKPCPGYEKYYDVSNMGNVRSYHTYGGKFDRSEVQRIKSIQIDTYLIVSLSKGIGVAYAKKVHILVAKLFVANPHNRKYVHHKNNDKLDPTYSNLEWVTASQNQRYAYTDGQRKRPIGQLNGRCKLSPSEVLKIFKSNENIYKTASTYSISTRAVTDIKTGRLWSHLTGKKYKKPTPKHTLTKKQVFEIVNSHEFQDDIAKKYGISQSRVSSIKTGRTHSGLTGIRFYGRKSYCYYGVITGIKKAS